MNIVPLRPFTWNWRCDLISPSGLQDGDVLSFKADGTWNMLSDEYVIIMSGSNVTFLTLSGSSWVLRLVED